MTEVLVRATASWFFRRASVIAHSFTAIPRVSPRGGGAMAGPDGCAKRSRPARLYTAGSPAVARPHRPARDGVHRRRGPFDERPAGDGHRCISKGSTGGPEGGA